MEFNSVRTMEKIRSYRGCGELNENMCPDKEVKSSIERMHLEMNIYKTDHLSEVVGLKFQPFNGI